MRDRSPTPLATLAEAATIGKAAGLRHVYIGNAPELDAEDTRCVSCGATVLARHGYRVVRRLSEDGSCPRCETPLPGRALAMSAPGLCG
jgi:pyruvate formate lyase activating enzyme